ncbi:MAG: VIT domain-containing protein [Fimbriimonadales bacterium]
MLKLLIAGTIVGTIAVVGPLQTQSQSGKAFATTDPCPGQLTIIQKDGKPGQLCPLQGTSVKADIAGFGARVTLVQTFTNPTPAAIEAVYTFPLPADAAVDRMRFRIGDRIVEGVIKRREEARRIYDAAKAAGQATALLDQERPNIFTQSVANIMLGAKIEVEISYVQVLKYADGQFEFSFPMVVGPRFLGNAPDPGKIAPPVTPKGTRTGANIDLSVTVDAGATIREMKSVLHDVRIDTNGSRARVVLKKKDEIPNRDFILRYRTAGDSVQSAFVSHMDPAKGGFFSLILLPPRRPAPTQIAPREVFFVIDQSGSQSGFPIEKSKELTQRMIGTMRPGDTFNVMGFSNGVNWMWPAPRDNSPENCAEAAQWVKNLQANGGTQLRAAVEAALQFKPDPSRLRLVLFNTDGFVGDEPAILGSVRKFRDQARLFTFGIGNGVNQFLIDGMSVEGKGDSETVTLSDKADDAVSRFVKRTQTPILTDVTAEVEGVQVEGLKPEAVPDVFDDRPIVVYGRYSQGGKGKITVRGKIGGEDWSQTLDVDFTSGERAPGLMSLWARRAVNDLERKEYLARYGEADANAVKNQIVDLGLDFGIMTAYTSFVAVEQRVINVGGKQRTVRVPVEMTDGVSYEGVGLDFAGKPASSPAAGNFRGGGFGGGGGGRGGQGGGGFGGGGFGGNSATGAAAQSKTQAGVSLQYEAAEKDMGLARLSPQEQRKANIETKIVRALRSAKGTVAVQVWVHDLKPETLAKLKKAGLKIDVADKGLKAVFGTCDAKILAELAQIEAVQRIEKLD